MQPNNEPRETFPTRKYDSVSSMVRNAGLSKNVEERLSKLINDSRVATRMAQLRHQAGLTQAEMAKELNVNQSTISKLETGRDDDITLGQIKDYSRVTGERISILAGRPFTQMEAVTTYAEALKHQLDALADLANQKPQLQAEIKGFLSETFSGLLSIVTQCNAKVVEDDDVIADIRVEIITGKSVVPTDPPMERKDQATCIKR